MRARWVRRCVALILAVGSLYAVLAVLGYEPRFWPLAALVATCVAVVWLTFDVLSVLADPGGGWRPEDRTPSSAGRDPRLAATLRTLENHVVAAAPDPLLRDRLAALTDARLRQRHGFDRSDPRAADVVGPDLESVLSGAVRRLSPDEIDRTLHRIEEL